MKRFLLLALLVMSASVYAETTSNLITNTWNNVTNGSHPNNCCTGGPGPLYDASTNTIHFSYGLTAVHQVQAINQALSGSGVQISGWNWGYDLRNMNGVAGGQNGTDTISATSFITNSAGQIIQQSDQYYNTQFDWTRFSGTETLTNPLTDYGSLGIQFVAKDYGYWAGYYGPQVRNVSLTANYTVDQCVINPRYSPSCPGYDYVWTTGNLTDVYGTSFALNQALGFGNSGVQVHSAIVGFDYNINGQYCSGGTVLGVCLGWSDSRVRMQWNVLDPNLGMIAYDDKTISGRNISGTYRNEVLIGRDISTIGNTSISINRTGNASVSNPYIGYTFAPDVACQNNPLVNSQCPGYQQAYFTQQCSFSALYDPQCPGYAAAYFTQQCSLNALYDPSCPGYAAAYLDYQCNQNQLYSTSCPEYEQAYLAQQCSISPLYSSACTGYQTAVTECTANPLTHTYCPSYQTAVNDCSTNGLTHSYCPSYTLEQQLCSTDPLSNTLCSGYATATTECNSNSLLYTYCPAYTTTLAACSTNPQSNTLCPGYSTTTTTVSTETTKTSEPAAVAVVSDPTVNSVVTSTATSTTSPTATVQLAPTTSSTSSPTQTAQTTQAEQKKETKQDDMAKQETKKDESSQTASASTQGKSDGNSSSGEKKTTARQEIAAKRAEARKQAAVEAGKKAAEEMDKATSFEAQTAVQTVVIAAMGFTPGFNAYSFIIPDVPGYKPFEIYKNQKTVDNARTMRFMSARSDKLHEQMVEAQWENLNGK